MIAYVLEHLDLLRGGKDRAPKREEAEKTTQHRHQRLPTEHRSRPQGTGQEPRQGESPQQRPRQNSQRAPPGTRRATAHSPSQGTGTAPTRHTHPSSGPGRTTRARLPGNTPGNSPLPPAGEQGPRATRHTPQQRPRQNNQGAPPREHAGQQPIPKGAEPGERATRHTPQEGVTGEQPVDEPPRVPLEPKWLRTALFTFLDPRVTNSTR